MITQNYLNYSFDPLCLVRSLGDIDKDPEATDLWISFQEEDRDEQEIRSERSAPTLMDLDDFNQSTSMDCILSLTEFKNSGELPAFKNLHKNSLKDQILKVFSGVFITDCLQNPIQNLSKGIENFDKEQIKKMLTTNYKKQKDGTIQMINTHLIQSQKQILGYLLKQFGSRLFSGQSITKICLPVTVFEPRSYLERQADTLIYAPYFLEKAGTLRNTFEQFRLTIAHFLATLHVDINPQKPFNPILGETFQGIIAGCPVYIEQISHHPPISAYQMIGKNFEIHGRSEFTASLSINSIKTRKVGFPKVTFERTKTVVVAQYPEVLMSGTTIGKQTLKITGKFYVFDLENNYYAEIDFDCRESSLFKPKRTIDQDYFSGSIWKINQNFADKLRQGTEKLRRIDIKFKEKEHAVAKLEGIEGKWLEYINIGDQVYWSLGNPWPYQLQYFDNPLPSDSNNRLDLMYLKIEDEIKSGEHKRIFEKVQRNDQILREKRNLQNYKLSL